MNKPPAEEVEMTREPAVGVGEGPFLQGTAGLPFHCVPLSHFFFGGGGVLTRSSVSNMIEYQPCQQLHQVQVCSDDWKAKLWEPPC